jgi:60 kDa SS-A/Ro ribonucleoprotein
MPYLKNILSRKATPQSLPIPGSGQVPNSAGGYAWAVTDWTRMDRFLILGSEGGSYYASERKLSHESAQAVVRCIQEDGPRAVARIVEVSESGRAPQNDPAIFALALAAAYGSDETRRLALGSLPRVCRIGTHLMHFAEYVEGFRGWGRGLRAAIARWYNGMPAEKLAYQAVKYQSRDGWSNRDLLRLSHPVPASDEHRTLYHWITQGWEGVGEEPHPVPALQMVWAFERAKRASSAKEVAELVAAYRLPREGVPTQWLNDRAIWEALLPEMGLTSLVRNLAAMTRVGLLESKETVAEITRRITDPEQIRRARVHPIAMLSALKTYAQGHGERGKSVWKPVPKVVDALDAGFYAAFGNVKPTDRRWLMALDVSGSMTCGNVAGVPGLTPRVASAAMALVTAAVEPDHRITAFSTEMVPVSISPRQRLDDVIRQTDRLPFGGTDCSLPMRWAAANRVEADVFVVLTDSETWFGNIHPAQALREYRERMGIPAKLVVVGMVSNGFTIADPNDAGMLDVVGFDSATPNLMADFAMQ